MHQDETGRLYMNGSIGKAVEWFRWASQVILIPVIVACGLWVVRVEKFHVQIEDFMEAGPRFTSGSGQFTSADDLRRQLALDVQAIMDKHDRVHDGLPPIDYQRLQNERYENLSKRLDDIQAAQRDILRVLQRRP